MHDHSTNEQTKERPLLIALGLTFTVLLVQVIGAVFTKSLALLSDAAHMSTDVTALLIALIAIRVSRRVADSMRTFGYHRFEILAAAFNTMMLFVVAAFILFEAYRRIGQPPNIHSVGMLIVACIGLITNLTSLLLLHSSKDKSLNLKGAYLEVLSDMVGSLGVIMAAILIKLTGWAWVDSVVAILIALWILPRAWILLKESINVLLEGTPKGIDLRSVEKMMLDVEGVESVHELHIWSISSDKICLTAHVVLNEKFDCDYILPLLREQLAAKFKIYHTTLQHERTDCLNEKAPCHFNPPD